MKRRICIAVVCILFFGAAVNVLYAQTGIINDAQVSVIEPGQSVPTEWTLGKLLQQLVDNVRANRDDFVSGLAALNAFDGIYRSELPVNDIIFAWSSLDYDYPNRPVPQTGYPVRYYDSNYPLTDGALVFYARTGAIYIYDQTLNTFYFNVQDGNGVRVNLADEGVLYDNPTALYAKGTRASYLVDLAHAGNTGSGGGDIPSDWRRILGNTKEPSPVTLNTVTWAEDIKLGNTFPALSLNSSDRQSAFNQAIVNKVNNIQSPPIRYQGRITYVLDLAADLTAIDTTNIEPGDNVFALDTGTLYTWVVDGVSPGTDGWDAGTTTVYYAGDYFFFKSSQYTTLVSGVSGVMVSNGTLWEIIPFVDTESNLFYTKGQTDAALAVLREGTPLTSAVTDLNTFLTPGLWKADYAVSSVMANTPTSLGFILRIYTRGGFVVQEVTRTAGTEVNHWMRIIDSQNSPATYGRWTPLHPIGYSTSEVFTGQYWIDGKPIYKRTVQTAALGSSPWNASESRVIVNDITSWNVARWIGVAEGMAGDYQTETFGHSDSRTQLKLRNSSSSNWSAGFITTSPNWFTVRYTKTTD
ncbi:MAG: hypothetical protein LBQ54_00985 [Planctomycetaceae bacterium]|jgi:hypothetical protein|nr:hypothetical protein [Planctomycetaceae bacterium]